MARTVAVTLLTLTPENAAHVRFAAARLAHASARGAIGAWVEAEAARMAGRDLASAFYPLEIEADPARLSVEVAGELVTWIGSEEASREDRRYRLVFRIDAGRIGLLRFEQMESGKMRRIFRRTRAALLAMHILTMGALAAPVPRAGDADSSTRPTMASSWRRFPRRTSTASRSQVTGSRRWCARRTDMRSSTTPRRAISICGPRAQRRERLARKRPRIGVRGQAGFEPVTLFIGTEKGFTYRLALMPAARASAQILIRNADAVPAAASVPVSGGEPHVGALVRLVRAVARREPLPGYAIHAGGRSLAAGIRLVETWRGPRFAALVLEADALPSAPAGGAAGLAGTIGSLPGIGPVAALWLAPPATGPSGGRLGVAVVEAAATGDLR